MKSVNKPFPSCSCLSFKTRIGTQSSTFQEMHFSCKVTVFQIKLISINIKGYAPGLIFKKRYKATQKWLISCNE